LDALDRFKSLKVLHLEGQSNGIEVLSQLRGLEDLTLRSITTSDLRYLAPLERLWSLDIKLGGIRSFDGIEGKDTIKYLDLWQIHECVYYNDPERHFADGGAVEALLKAALTHELRIDDGGKPFFWVTTRLPVTGSLVSRAMLLRAMS